MEPPKKPIVAISLNALGGFKLPPAIPPVPGTVAPGQDLPRLPACPRDTDGDGNCDIHPRGCLRALAMAELEAGIRPACMPPIDRAAHDLPPIYGATVKHYPEDYPARLTEEQAAGLMKTALESVRLDQALARIEVAITNLEGIRCTLLDILNNPDAGGKNWGANDQLHAFLDAILAPPEGDHDLDAATIEAIVDMVPEQQINEPDGE